MTTRRTIATAVASMMLVGMCVYIAIGKYLAVVVFWAYMALVCGPVDGTMAWLWHGFPGSIESCSSPNCEYEIQEMCDAVGVSVDRAPLPEP